MGQFVVLRLEPVVPDLTIHYGDHPYATIVGHFWRYLGEAYQASPVDMEHLNRVWTAVTTGSIALRQAVFAEYMARTTGVLPRGQLLSEFGVEAETKLAFIILVAGHLHLFTLQAFTPPSNGSDIMGFQTSSNLLFELDLLRRMRCAAGLAPNAMVDWAVTETFNMLHYAFPLSAEEIAPAVDVVPIRLP